MNDEGCIALANAIIIQAVKDYRLSPSPQVRNEIKRFFLSQWFTMLSGANGEVIIKRLEQERGVKNNGKERNKLRGNTDIAAQ